MTFQFQLGEFLVALSVVVPSEAYVPVYDTHEIGVLIPSPAICDAANNSKHKAFYVSTIIEKFWEEWRKAEPRPDSNNQFCDWLRSEKGWKNGPEMVSVSINS